MERIAVIGAGLVGSLLSLFLARRGHSVDVYEKRPDMRSKRISAGRSINLALSTRGWTALEKVGLADEIGEIAIPMKGRMIHNEDGTTVFQPYGREGEAIFSVSRGELNKRLMTAAEAHEQVNYHFEEKCVKLNFKDNKILMRNTAKDQLHEISHDLVFGADGAFSRIRYGLQKTPRFNYSQHYLEHGYKELVIPAGPNGSFRIEKNALHIWPRHSFMLIALPNLDGSFTCTLFARFEGENSFSGLKDRADVERFFTKYFADAIPHMPTYLDDFFSNPTSALVTVRCHPWIHNNIALIGDAAHAIVPFYGQGMNAGFEDCTVLDQLIDEHKGEWPAIFEAYNEGRKADADAIADLAIQNFLEMRDRVADPEFLMKKKIERQLEDTHPDFRSQYSMVTFSNVPYADALRAGEEQQELLQRILDKKVVNLSEANDEIESVFNDWLREFSH